MVQYTVKRLTTLILYTPADMFCILSTSLLHDAKDQYVDLHV